jgi:hypothetical protein
MIDQVLLYADLGFSVIPMHYTRSDGKCSCLSPTCGSVGKHPKIRWKDFTSRCLKASELKRFWDEDPETNVGIVTGEISGVTVLDIDGQEGIRSLADIGINLSDLPDTPTVSTGGGGLHLYFRYPESQTVLTRAGVLKHVDIRSDGGVVVAPPSMHRSGKPYTWVEGKGIQSLDPADFDFARLAPGITSEEDGNGNGTGGAWFDEALRGVAQGGRNETAARLAGRYYSLGMSPAEVLHLLHAWNATNAPPLDAEEVEKISNSIYKRVRAGVSIGDREEVLSTLSKLIGIKVLSVRRVTGDTPRIIVEFSLGLCPLTTAQLISPKEFQRAVCEATKVLIRKRGVKSSPSHERMAQMILDASEDVDAGEEATAEGELAMLLKDYLLSQKVVRLDHGEIPVQGSFWKDGLIWISLMDLVQAANVRWGMRSSIREMAQRLKAYGVERRTMTNGPVARNLWGIDPREIDWAVPEEQEETIS